jgi:hypothetical protein
MTYYISVFHATCERIEVLRHANPKLHNDGDNSRVYKTVLYTRLNVPSARRVRTTENTARVLLAACVLLALPSSGSIRHITDLYIRRNKSLQKVREAKFRNVQYYNWVLHS